MDERTGATIAVAGRLVLGSAIGSDAKQMSSLLLSLEMREPEIRRVLE